jgi:pimeloyl-ACP methyl ester carboxylesterase
LNSKPAREAAANALARAIDRYVEEGALSSGPQINLVGFSHGGNVAVLATRILPPGRILNLVTIATPVLRAYQPARVENHVHVYNPSDAIQARGGEAFFIPGRGTVGRAKRRFARASNIAIDIKQGNAASRHGDLLYSKEMWEKIAERLIK